MRRREQRSTVEFGSFVSLSLLKPRSKDKGRLKSSLGLKDELGWSAIGLGLESRDRREKELRLGESLVRFW